MCKTCKWVLIGMGVFAAIVIAGFVFLFSLLQKETSLPTGTVETFEECAAAGNPVMESYPRQCRADGQTFVEHIGNELEKVDLIILDAPRPNQAIVSPL